MAIETRETASFNFALLYLSRINSVLSSNYTEFKNHNPAGFAKNLRQLYRELAPWLKKEERDEIQKDFDILARIPKTDIDAVWRQLEDIELDMRVHFKALGMLMPKLSDPRFLFSKQS
jgi:hypothetical protein